MAPKIAAISSIVRLIGWISPTGRGRRRQGRVDALVGEAGVQRGTFQRHAARLDRGGQRVLQPVQRGAALPALLGRGPAEVLEQRGQPPVASQHPDPHRVPRAQIAGGGERGVGFGLQGEEVVGHQSL